MTQQRYSTHLTQDYPLLLNAFPHSEEMHAEIGKSLERYFGPKSGLIGLDIGSGGGESTKYIMEYSSPSIIDLVDPDNIQMTRLLTDLGAVAKKRGILLRPHEEDIFDFMPKVKDNSYDFIASAWTIHNFEKDKREKILREVYRTLTPGGIFVNMDKYVPDDAKEEERLHSRQVKRYHCLAEMGRPDLEIKMIAHDEEDRKPELMMKEGESIVQLKKIGFRDVRLTKRMEKEAIIIAIK
ncbi:MAG: class I SAM-dependent methyltransferase [archaeon]